MRHVLVTGGTGFTGGHLCQRLVSEGYITRTIARNGEQARHLKDCGVQVVVGDVCLPETLMKAVDDVDTVIHMAALYRTVTDDNRYWAVNLGGTKNVLDAAVTAGVQRFVHCSTVGVHGDVKDQVANEESPYRPSDVYQESKLAGESLVRQFGMDSRLEVVVCRPAGIYGPRDFRFLKLIKAIKRERFAMIGTGETRFHLVYIDDLIDGFLQAATCDNAAGNVYILAGEEIVTLNELVAMLADILGVHRPTLKVPFAPVLAAAGIVEALCKPLHVQPPIFRRRVEFFVKNRAFNIAKAKTELRFQPKVDLRTGFERTIAWYQQNHVL